VMATPHVYTWGLDPTKLKQTKSKKCCLPSSEPSLHNKGIIQVAAGSHFNAALSRDGSVYTWGVGARGRLGHKTEEDKLAPTKVKGLEGQKVISLACGSWHMGAVTEGRDLFLWGSISKNKTTYAPEKVVELVGKKVVSLGCGQQWTAIILENGHLVILDKQFKVCEYDSARFVGVWCGSDFGAAVDDQGEIWIFGVKIEANIYGPSKPKVTEKNSPTKILSPVKIDLTPFNIPRVRKCVCSTGEFHQSIGVLTEGGDLYMWGSNYKGKLGVGDFENRAIPTMVNFGKPVADVEIGGIHATAITQDGQLYTFGCGSDGRLGHPESKDHTYLFHESAPRRVDALQNRTQQISCSYYHCIALVE